MNILRKISLILVFIFPVATLYFTPLARGDVERLVAPLSSTQDCARGYGTCYRWYFLDQLEHPTAWDYDRPSLHQKHQRWYSVTEEAPRPAKVEARKITIDQMIHFDFDKSNIKPESYGTLDDVASVLKNNPQIKKLRIEGHTDWIGSDEYNMKLSDRRAASVREYLVNKGIDSSRLESVGYGESRPIADNKTDEGRAQNRRTEFNVVEQ